ncbi:MAG: polysaccharide biosynthesis/export family protein [Syntrophobacteraceae bacterium]
MRLRTLLLLVLSLLVYCCGPFSENAKKVGLPGTEVPPMESEYRIRVGDKLSIKLFYNPDLNQECIVRPDGRISLLLVQDINAAGRTPRELTVELNQIYDKYLQQPEVVVIVNSFAGHKVFVGGEVNLPGAKDISGPTTVLQAVYLALGFKDTARLNEVVLIRRGPDFKPYLVALDIEKAMKGIDIKQDVFLQPYDIVLVPRSNIADVNLWINQYLRTPLSVPRDFLYYYQFGEAVRAGTVGTSGIGGF